MRALLAIAAALLLWEGFVRLTDLPPYLLPGPLSVGRALWDHRAELAPAALLTAWETLLGLALGAALGIATAAAMAAIVGPMEASPAPSGAASMRRWTVRSVIRITPPTSAAMQRKAMS